jgi:hypothetical protein
MGRCYVLVLANAEATAAFLGTFLKINIQKMIEYDVTSAMPSQQLINVQSN